MPFLQVLKWQNIDREKEMSKEKIKVLQFTVAAGKGGRTLYVLNNWKHIDKSRFQFDFITFSPTLDFEQELLDEGCKVFHMSCYPEQNREKFIQELDVVLDQGYDAIHIHTSFWADTIVEERAKAKGIKKIIIHSHSTGFASGTKKYDVTKEEDMLRLHNAIKENLSIDIATDYWACSEPAAEWLYGKQIPKTKIKIMKNAIDASSFAYNPQMREMYRKELGLEGFYVYGIVGRLAYEKNQDFLLQVFKKICDERNDCKLIIVGHGEKEMEYKEFVRENKLENKVIFTGFRTDVNCLLQAMDCLCMPSKFEGFPIVLVEAQASGLRCVVSDIITKEVLISDLIQSIPLEQERWVEELNKIKVVNREEYAEIIREVGFDIKEQILKLENLYLEKGN